MKRRLGVALCGLLTVFWLWLLTQCFNLMNLPSDVAVVIGLLGIMTTVIVAPWTYGKTWFKFIKPALNINKPSGDTNE